MYIEGILTTKGEPLVMNNLVNFLGYQIQHKKTGRLLPQTDSFTVFTANAAIQKLDDVKYFYENYEGFDVTEYEFITIYDFELESGWIQITHEKDWEQ